MKFHDNNVINVFLFIKISKIIMCWLNLYWIYLINPGISILQIQTQDEDFEKYEECNMFLNRRSFF